jgi:hypothetical protein
MYETETAQPVYWMVASDVVQEVKATGLHNHTVQLVEPTKWLERWMVGSKAVTQPAYKDYTQIDVGISNPNLYGDYNFPTTYFDATVVDGAGLKTGYGYISPYFINGATPSIYPPSALQTPGLIEQISGNEILEYHFRIFKNGYLIEEGGENDIQQGLNLSVGKYDIVYDWVWSTSPPLAYNKAHAEYSFYVIPAQSVTRKTLCDAARQFIWAAQSLVGAEPSVFILTDQAEAKLQGDAPELTGGGGIFVGVTATVYYPANNATWTAEVMETFGGEITWVPYNA